MLDLEVALGHLSAGLARVPDGLRGAVADAIGVDVRSEVPGRVELLAGAGNGEKDVLKFCN